MPRLNKKDSELKISLLNKAFLELQKKSTATKNLATPKKIAQLASSFPEAKTFNYCIKEQSLKQPSSKPYMELANKIKKHREEYNATKKTSSRNTLNTLKENEITINSLLQKVDKLVNINLEQHDEIKYRDEKISRYKSTIVLLNEKIKILEDLK